MTQGLALATWSSERKRLVLSGWSVGTVNYMAPEQLEGWPRAQISTLLAWSFMKWPTIRLKRKGSAISNGINVLIHPLRLHRYESRKLGVLEKVNSANMRRAASHQHSTERTEIRKSLQFALFTRTERLHLPPPLEWKSALPIPHTSASQRGIHGTFGPL